jgi:hypothetical protein
LTDDELSRANSKLFSYFAKSLMDRQMKTIFQLISVVLLFLFTGCVTLYKPNTVHSPLLKEKGDFNTSASLGISGSGLYNATAAYALSDHVGVVADGMYHYRRSGNGGSTTEKLRMSFAEGGAGYFEKFGSNQNWLFQGYGGGGFGSTTDRMENALPPVPQISARYFNIFLQPGVAMTKKYLDLAFDMRINYVRLYNINASLYNEFDFWNTDFIYTADTSLDFVNLEPSVTLRVGGENVKALVQLGVIIPFINSQSYFDVNNASLFIAPLFKCSVGISFAFGKKKKIN